MFVRGAFNDWAAFRVIDGSTVPAPLLELTVTCGAPALGSLAVDEGTTRSVVCGPDLADLEFAAPADGDY